MYTFTFLNLEVIKIIHLKIFTLHTLQEYIDRTMNTEPEVMLVTSRRDRGWRDDINVTGFVIRFSLESPRP